jgi:hypothetical protein
MKIYAICEIYPNEPDIIIRYYKTKEDAKWGLNKLMAGEDESYEWNEYGEYEIIEIEVEE